jgi:hypothetical protein
MFLSAVSHPAWRVLRLESSRSSRKVTRSRAAGRARSCRRVADVPLLIGLLEQRTLLSVVPVSDINPGVLGSFDSAAADAHLTDVNLRERPWPVEFRCGGYVLFQYRADNVSERAGDRCVLGRSTYRRRYARLERVSLVWEVERYGNTGVNLRRKRPYAHAARLRTGRKPRHPHKLDDYCERIQRDLRQLVNTLQIAA